MNEYTLQIRYGNKMHALKAAVTYESNQVMRIRVFGKRSSILLENNFPLMQCTQSKAAIKWKLKEGNLGNDPSQSARLLTGIIEQLEYFIKEKHKGLTKQEYLMQHKR